MVAAVVIGAPIGVWQTGVIGGGGGPPPVGTANLWVDTNGGTCVRQSTPASYVDAAACDSLPRAYNAAQAGDTILVRCGTYPEQTFNLDKSAGAYVVIQPETNFCATIGTISGGVNYEPGGAYSTLQYFNILGGVFKGNYGARTSSHVNIFHNHINVDQHTTGQSIYSGGSMDNWNIDYNTIGPLCCGDHIQNPSGSSPEGMRFATDAPGHDNTNIEIKGNLFQSIMRFCRDWPTTYITVENSTPQSAGACPAADEPLAHMDGIHVYGLQNSLITQNRLYNVACTGMFFEDTNGDINGPMTITNNVITTNSDSCNGIISVQPRPGNPSMQGEWTIAFNSGNSQIHLNVGAGGALPGSHFTIVGNLASLYLPSNSGTGSAACNGWADADVTATYAYNAWEFKNGAQNTTCGVGDVYPVSPTYVDPVFDLHLTGSATAADNLVPASTCNAVTNVDFQGDHRPINTNCDAGADERN